MLEAKNSVIIIDWYKGNINLDNNPTKKSDIIELIKDGIRKDEISVSPKNLADKACIQ